MKVQQDWTRGPCEFGTGEATYRSAPTVTVCGKPGRVRQGIMWCDVYACDKCFERWSGARTRDHGDEGK